MKKRSIQLLSVVAVAGAILWSALPGSKSEDDQTAAKTPDEDAISRMGDSGQLEPLENMESESTIARESPRHAAGALEKYRQENSLVALNKAVLEQETKVEERKKVLATIVRTKGIIYKESNEPGDQSREEAVKRGLDEEEYAAAKLEFEAEHELLQEMKLKQIGEAIKARQDRK